MTWYKSAAAVPGMRLLGTHFSISLRFAFNLSGSHLLRHKTSLTGGGFSRSPWGLDEATVLWDPVYGILHRADILLNLPTSLRKHGNQFKPIPRWVILYFSGLVSLSLPLSPHHPTRSQAKVHIEWLTVAVCRPMVHTNGHMIYAQ